MDFSSLFFQLLQIAIGHWKTLEPKPTRSEWEMLFTMAKKQSLSGICFSGVEKLPIELSPGEELIMDWMGEVVKIKRKNNHIEHDVSEVVAWMDSEGFDCCLLKGQGNAQLYPNPARRTPGDIDLWVRPKKRRGLENDIKTIISFVKSKSTGASAIYHHVDGLKWNGSEVEVHYRPHFMQNYYHNTRLQQYFLENADEQFSHKTVIGGREVAVPTPDFNIVFQMAHIYQHLFHEGIGLRQVLDYYYVLKSYVTSSTGNNKDWNQLLKQFGLYNIASAIMWILVEKFGMEKSWAVVRPNKRRGQFVLNEMLLSGNFGKYDERNTHYGSSKFGKNMQRLVRDCRLVKYFPTEALSEPLFRLYHAWWRYTVL